MTRDPSDPSDPSDPRDLSDPLGRAAAVAFEPLLARAYAGDEEARAALIADPRFTDPAGLALATQSFAAKRAHKARHRRRRPSWWRLLLLGMR
jgi:hypothetical protein